ncbi:hypothetical protein H6P81_006284 [Aristolochia fimbriata]|uniref:Uncharacterized protein n=1 Tax=Aristolochia fimbriata TaxID=158543 RepID=A0AAV7EWW0_ARIFI|nr:hypothetical protein H6P81_006284 [Aristolochia fimbriata]
MASATLVVGSLIDELLRRIETYVLSQLGCFGTTDPSGAVLTSQLSDCCVVPGGCRLSSCTNHFCFETETISNCRMVSSSSSSSFLGLIASDVSIVANGIAHRCLRLLDSNAQARSMLLPFGESAFGGYVVFLAMPKSQHDLWSHPMVDDDKLCCLSEVDETLSPQRKAMGDILLSPLHKLTEYTMP